MKKKAHMKSINEMKRSLNEKLATDEVKDKEHDAQSDTEALPDDAAFTALEEKTADAESRVNELTAKLDEITDRYQRSLAEFDNFRKRTQKEKASMYDDGVADTVKSLLPVIDSFTMALKSADGLTETEKQAPIYKGMELIVKQLNQFMEQNGIAEIATVGETFNPDLHEAIAHIESGEHGENVVVEELQKGYTLKGKVIRYSMVKSAN